MDKSEPLFTQNDWQACYQSFCESLRSPATQVRYSSVLRSFFCLDKSPEDYTRADVSTFVHSPSKIPWCRDRGGKVAVSTRNARVSAIRSFYAYASAYSIAGLDGHPVPLFGRADPTIGIKHDQANRAYKTLTLEEVQRFFKVIDQQGTIFGARDRAIFLCYLLTCRRRSELCTLRWGDISYGTIQDEQGNTHQGHLFTFRGKGRQAILDRQELPETCYTAILVYLEQSGRLATMKPDSPVFTAEWNQHGGNVRQGEERILSSKGIVNRLKIYCRLAEIDERKFSLHSLRHTGAYLRTISGEGLLSLSRTLRHTSVSTTQIYLEALVTHADNGSKLVENRLRSIGVL